jgi:hypothetical protein
MTLEKTIEARVVRWAKEHGIKTRKMNGSGFRGWPDRLFVLPKGRLLWIEFKRPGGRLSTLQELLIGDLEALGHQVRVYDDPVKAIEGLRLLLEAK